MDNNFFSIKRVSQLIKNDLILQSKTIFIVALTLIVASAILPFHVSTSLEFYFLMLYLVGFIYTANAFNDLHDPRKSLYFLTLPASNLEKFFSKWLLTSIGYAVVLLLAYYVFSWLGVLVNILFNHQAVYPLNIFQSYIWLDIGRYMVFQSVILFGAILFKKHALIKTALSVACLLFVINIFSLMLSSSFYINNINNWEVSFHSQVHSGLSFMWVLLAPVCLLLAYFKLSKYELN